MGRHAAIKPFKMVIPKVSRREKDVVPDIAPAPGGEIDQTPPGMVGTSSLEERVYQALIAAGWDKMNIAVQTPILGGRVYRGGLVVDFILYRPMALPIKVNGEHWHRDSAEEQETDARIQEYFGVEPITIWGDEAKTAEETLATVIRLVGRGE